MHVDKSHTLVLGGCIGGIVVGLVVLLLVATLLSAAVALVTGGGNGARGECLPDSPAPVATQGKQANTSPTPLPTGLSMCVPASGMAAAVVQLAEQMAQHLYVNPACGSTRSFPECYYSWYDSGFPKAVVAYGNRICPGCAAWTNGNYQCVSFVRGAYSQSYPMDQTADAFFLWGMYQSKPGWMEIAANPQAQTPTIHLGPPLPGDIVVMKDSGLGHVAIITAVSLPDAQGNRMVTFANANSIRPLDHLTVRADLVASRPPGWSPAYVAWGYIRPAVRGGHEAGSIPDHPSVPVARQDDAGVGISPDLVVNKDTLLKGLLIVKNPA